MNSTASQSSSLGWLGGSPCVPKSSLVSTRPMPKTCSQKRFTSTRAVSGLFVSTSQRAKASRFVPLFGGKGFSTAGTPGDTRSPFVRKLPRTSMCVSRGFASSSSTIEVGIESLNFFSTARAAASASRGAFNSGAALSKNSFSFAR